MARQDGTPSGLFPVFVAIASLAVLVPVLVQVVNQRYGWNVQLGPWLGVLFIAAGFWGTWVRSLGAGVGIAALSGLLLSVAGGITFLVLGSELPSRGARTFMSPMVLTTMIGTLLGFVGGFPVALWKGWRRRLPRDP